MLGDGWVAVGGISVSPEDHRRRTDVRWPKSGATQTFTNVAADRLSRDRRQAGAVVESTTRGSAAGGA